MNSIRVLVADDHELVREGIAHLLEHEGGISVLDKVCNGKEALQSMLDNKPDVSILDLHLPQLNGCEVTDLAYRRGYPGKIIIMSQVDSEEYGRASIHSGASGFVLKRCDKEELVTAVREVAKGETYVSSEFSKVLLRGFLRKIGEHEGHSHLQKLTEREIEILKHVAEGMTSKEIAEKLFVSPRTVDFHRRRIMAKLRIHDLPTLVRFAVQAGLVENMPFEGFEPITFEHAELEI